MLLLGLLFSASPDWLVKLVEAGGRTSLTLISLIIVVIGALAYVFFGKESAGIKILTWLLMFGGAACLITVLLTPGKNSEQQNEHVSDTIQRPGKAAESRKPAKVAVQRYRPVDPSIPAAAAMNIEVIRRDTGGLYELAVSFTIPPAPPNAANPYLTDLIKISGGQRTFPSPGVPYTPVAPIPLPPSTFPDVHASWKTGDRVNFTVQVPKQFSDPTQGWIINFCASTNKGCFPSPNLLMGTPI
jgi:hypothetical protein